MRGEAKYAKPIWTICFILAACEKQKTGSRWVEGGGGFDIQPTSKHQIKKVNFIIFHNQSWAKRKGASYETNFTPATF